MCSHVLISKFEVQLWLIFYALVVSFTPENNNQASDHRSGLCFNSQQQKDVFKKERLEQFPAMFVVTKEDILCQNVVFLHQTKWFLHLNLTQKEMSFQQVDHKHLHQILMSVHPEN